jgi:hypothetical protein
MNRFLATLSLVFLAACAGPQLPLSKDEPLTVASDSLVRPPWEALVKAGPGAEKDIDLETLNGPQVAAAPAPVETPVVPEPAPTPPKPGDTVIKAVAVLPVTGVGGGELTAAMRKVLKDAGWPVISSKRADALTLQGSATLDAALNGQQMVHLVWRVLTPKGKDLGDIKQNNAVPAGSLNSGWGENAGFATQAAATGIFKLIDGFR